MGPALSKCKGSSRRRGEWCRDTDQRQINRETVVPKKNIQMSGNRTQCLSCWEKKTKTLWILSSPFSCVLGYVERKTESKEDKAKAVTTILAQLESQKGTKRGPASWLAKVIKLYTVRKERERYTCITVLDYCIWCLPMNKITYNTVYRLTHQTRLQSWDYAQHQGLKQHTWTMSEAGKGVRYPFMSR